MSKERYKAVLMSGSWQSEWYNTPEEAWDYISTIGCSHATPCEMCQAEYDVFSEKELRAKLSEHFNGEGEL